MSNPGYKDLGQGSAISMSIDTISGVYEHLWHLSSANTYPYFSSYLLGEALDRRA